MSSIASQINRPSNIVRAPDSFSPRNFYDKYSPAPSDPYIRDQLYKPNYEPTKNRNPSTAQPYPYQTNAQGYTKQRQPVVNRAMEGGGGTIQEWQRTSPTGRTMNGLTQPRPLPPMSRNPTIPRTPTITPGGGSIATAIAGAIPSLVMNPPWNPGSPFNPSNIRPINPYNPPAGSPQGFFDSPNGAFTPLPPGSPYGEQFPSPASPTFWDPTNPSSPLNPNNWRNPFQSPPNTNIPDGLFPGGGNPGGSSNSPFNPNERYRFNNFVRIKFWAPAVSDWREYDVIDFEIRRTPEPLALIYPPNWRFSVQFTQPNGNSTYEQKNGPQIDITTFRVLPPGDGQPDPEPLPDRPPMREPPPIPGFVGPPLAEPLSPVAPAPPGLQPTGDPTRQNEGEGQRNPNPNAPPPFLMPPLPRLPVAPTGFANPTQGQQQGRQQNQQNPRQSTGNQLGSGAQTSSGLQNSPIADRVTVNPVGPDGKITPGKIKEVEQKQNKEVMPDMSTPPVCQDTCIADLQRGQRNQDELVDIRVQRFQRWDRVFGAIYIPEVVKVPRSLVPFALMMGNRTADIRSRFGLAELRARLTQVMNVLSTAATLHNAAMLSANLGQTLGDVVTQSVQTFSPMFGVDKEVAETFDFNEVLGKAVNTTMENALGKEVWNGTKTTFTKLNRIVTTASQIVWTVRSIADSAREISEWTAENTGKIGNALKRFRVVGENAYNWMPERVVGQSRWQQRIQRFMEGTENIDDAASSLSSVVGEVRSITEEVNELKEQKENFDKAIKEATPNNRPDNDATKKAANEADQASKSPNLNVSDREKGDAP